jgi:hypothetical protein
VIQGYHWTGRLETEAERRDAYLEAATRRHFLGGWAKGSQWTRSIKTDVGRRDAILRKRRHKTQHVAQMNLGTPNNTTFEKRRRASQRLIATPPKTS